jgi:tol-pal system protein YbgF
MKKIVFLFVFGALFVAFNAKAQDVFSLQQDLDDMREDIKVLQRKMYNNEDGSSAAQLTRLDEQVRSVSGRFEELEYKIRQLEEKINLINKDLDVRMSLLEGKKVSANNDNFVADNTPKFAAPVAVDAPMTITGDSISRDDNLKPANGDTAPEIYQSGLEALKAQQYDEAEKKFNKVLNRFPDDKLAGNAQYWLGETYYGRKQYEKSAVAFAKGYQQYHNGTKAPDSLLKLGMSMQMLNKNKEACAAFVSLAKEFPKAEKNIKDKAAAEAKKLGCK